MIGYDEYIRAWNNIFWTNQVEINWLAALYDQVTHDINMNFESHQNSKSYFHFIYLPRYPKQREWGSWAHNVGLTHLSLVHSPGPSVVLCLHYQYL